MIVDASALLAYFDASEPDHDAVVAAINAATDSLVVSPYVVAKLDYLVATRVGVQAELQVLRELGSGAWQLASLDHSDMGVLADLVATYHDLDIGVADASNILLADRHNTHVVATLDRRHFSVVRSLSGRFFDVVPRT